MDNEYTVPDFRLQPVAGAHQMNRAGLEALAGTVPQPPAKASSPP